MKMKFIIAVAALLITANVNAKRVPTTVQGTPYAETLNSKGTKKIVPTWEWDPNPDSPALPQNEFTFEDIENWTGEGENRAALVIQWNDPRETHALVFGYRWDGLATGADMIRAVVSNNPRLYGLIQYTNVSSPTDPLGGYTINGFGWDVDADGEIALRDDKDNQIYTAEDGLFIHPRGYNPEVGGSSDYDYDDWKAVDADDLWGAGWYLSYWSYWVKDSQESDFGYSGWGASGRVLENGSWDGWNFALDMMASDWKEFKAAPSSIPDGAKTEFEVNGLYFSLTDFQSGKVKLVNPAVVTTIENPSPYTGVISIPSEFIDGEKSYTVTEIADEAFKGSSVTSLTLPASIGKIGKSAFSNSTLFDLKGEDGVDLTKTVTSIGQFAFEGCSGIKNLLLPDAMTSVPEGLFKGCGLTEIVISSSIKSISASAFEGNVALQSVEIPQSVTEIGSKAFYGCDALKSVKVNSVYPPASFEDTFEPTAYANASLLIPTGFKAEYEAKEGWKNFAKVEFFNIPVNDGDTFSLNDVTFKVQKSEDSESVMITYPKVDGDPSRDKIKAANALLSGDILIPATVSYMGKEYPVISMSDSAFYGAANITSVVINANLESIPAMSFYDCGSLANISLPESLKKIGDYAFSYAGIQSIKIPDTVEALGSHVFFQCKQLKEVNVPTSLKEVPDYCFSYCSALEKIAFGNQVEMIGSRALQNCSSLKEAILPNGLETISDYMFSNCISLENIDIPTTVKNINSSAFSSCSKLNLSLPAGLKTLGNTALSGIANEEIRIPASISELPNYLFSGCKNLKSVTLSDDVTAFGTYVFQNCSALEKVSVVKADADIQTAAEEETSGITFPSKLTSIGNYCFQGCQAIDKVVIPEGVIKVGQSLFNKCSSLVEAVLPNSVMTLQSGMFQECKALENLTLGSQITSIPQNFVRDCNNLEWVIFKGSEDKAVAGKLELPESVATIASWPFANCKKLTEVIIPSKVTKLEMNTFDGCSSLSNVYIPDGLSSIGNYVFRNTALKELVIPESVNSMNYASDVVYGCNDVKVYVCNPGDPRTVGSNAFRIASGKYAEVCVPFGKKQIYENANSWKNSMISEFIPEISFVGEEADNSYDDNADISIEVLITPDENLPERFVKANEKLLFEEGEFALLWRFVDFAVEQTPETLQLLSDEGEGGVTSSDEERPGNDFGKTLLELDSDGKALVSISRPEKSSVIEAKLHLNHSSSELESMLQKISVKGKDITTVIEEIENSIEDASIYYDLNGNRIQRPERGIFIRVSKGRIEKRKK